MSKSPGFWFFTGDWLKDSELRFCSIFARGLLVDLLCILFEAKERGYASKPDGTPRTNEEIVSAVSGGSIEEKLAALAELESSGVLSRDNRGVLYSRRLARLDELTQKRSKAGSKGGSKAQAKAKQNDKQNTGVTVSDSVSDSDTEFTHTHTAKVRKGNQPEVPTELAECWSRWIEFRFASDGKSIPPVQAEAILMDLGRRGAEKAARDIDFSIRKDAKSILDSDNDFERQRSDRRSGSPRKDFVL